MTILLVIHIYHYLKQIMPCMKQTEIIHAIIFIYNVLNDSICYLCFK